MSLNVECPKLVGRDPFAFFATDILNPDPEIIMIVSYLDSF